MPQKYYITTAIPYASAVPHVGNTYEAILTDALARFQRLRGKDVYFLTGTDEHGQKIETMAKEEGVAPADVAGRNTAAVMDIWKGCLVEASDFIRTSEPRHIKVVQGIYRRLLDSGDLYKSRYEGWYCVPDESFYTDTQVGEGHLCPDCGRPVTKSTEESYFFRLSAYTDRLRTLFAERPDFVVPEGNRREMENNFLKPGLQDICVTRSTFTWGVPLDFDPEHVAYVWIDALTNYISALGYDPIGGNHSELFTKYWPCDAHIIGKDILRFHSLFWPAVLMSLDVELPRQVFAHPWYMMNGDKISKSTGNVAYTTDLCENYGVDAVRYYLLREMPYAQDGNYTEELFRSRYNIDLANNLGNLASRTVAMCHKYFGGSLPAIPQEQWLGSELLTASDERQTAVTGAWESFHLATALTESMRLVDSANPYIDKTMPWALAKDPDKQDELALCLHVLCETLRRASVHLYPVMPTAMTSLRHMLGLPAPANWDEAPPDGYTLNPAEILFPRLENN